MLSAMVLYSWVALSSHSHSLSSYIPNCLLSLLLLLLYIGKRMHFWCGSYCQNMDSNMFSNTMDVKLVRKYHNNEFVPIFISFYSWCAAQQHTRNSPIHVHSHTHIRTIIGMGGGEVKMKRMTMHIIHVHSTMSATSSKTIISKMFVIKCF